MTGGDITSTAPADSPAARPTRVRHSVLWLTVLAYMITYMDRVVISTAAPSIQAEFSLSKETMGWILGAFQISYALFQIPGGWLGDRFGPRAALTAVVTWWSAFTAATALTWSAGSIIVCRFLFGMGEAGAFPIATRSLSRWMLPAERGWAQGLTHAGSRMGGAITPLIVVYMIASFGWRAPFLVFALVGLGWAALWWFFYRNSPAEHPGVNAAERALIEDAIGQSGKGKPGSVPWRIILSAPQIWLLSVMYFCYGWGIVTFLQWFPTYLSDARGLELKAMGIAASIPLLAGVAGDLAGGWLSDTVLRRTGRITFARRLIICVGFIVAAVAVPLAATNADPIAAIAWFGLAVFGLELVVGVAWAIPLDIGGEYAGSVSAVMNTFGNLAGAIAAVATGYIVAQSGWESAFFVISGLAMVGALLSLKVDASRKLL
ncbi:MFS transporter [Sphingobium algorifonticola]|uniref:MFS transporter n=2 Tax=Sphingobium algorifonticola TaxID=2008318 RepID=A0A437JE59_9SPHN|nr:MFS transporter [Sphingobium algorifonticola]